MVVTGIVVCVGFLVVAVYVCLGGVSMTVEAVRRRLKKLRG